MKYLITLFTLLLTLSLDAGRIKEHEPWFAGTLLAYYGRNIGKNEIAFETYAYATRLRGLYNKDSKLIKDRNTHQYQLELEFKAGLSKTIDFELEIMGYYAHNQGVNDYQFGDTTCRLAFQLLEDQKDSWVPDLRIIFAENFPTGKYDGLAAELSGADATGSGSFESTLIFITRKIFYRDQHHFSWTYNFLYTIPTKTRVDGRNVYVSDGQNIKGEVRPGVEFIMDLAFEYKFNQPWGCGIDIYYEHQNSASFTGKRPLILPINAPSTETLSLAPMVEYNFSPKLSFIAGTWFTVAGRNSLAFTSGVIFFFYEF